MLLELPQAVHATTRTYVACGQLQRRSCLRAWACGWGCMARTRTDLGLRGRAAADRLTDTGLLRGGPGRLQRQARQQARLARSEKLKTIRAKAFQLATGHVYSKTDIAYLLGYQRLPSGGDDGGDDDEGDGMASTRAPAPSTTCRRPC